MSRVIVAYQPLLWWEIILASSLGNRLTAVKLQLKTCLGRAHDIQYHTFHHSHVVASYQHKLKLSVGRALCRFAPIGPQPPFNLHQRNMKLIGNACSLNFSYIKILVDDRGFVVVQQNSHKIRLNILFSIQYFKISHFRRCKCILRVTWQHPHRNAPVRRNSTCAHTATLQVFLWINTHIRLPSLFAQYVGREMMQWSSQSCLEISTSLLFELEDNL